METGINNLGTCFPRGKAGKKDMNILLTEFLSFERAKGRREQYLRDLKYRVPRLLHYLSERGIPLGALKVRGALSFQGALIEARTGNRGKYATATVLSYVFAALAFYEFLKEKGFVASNPFKEIRKVRAERKLPRNLLKEKEMNHFLETLSHFETGKTLRHQVMRYRVHVIAELMYSTGLRINEGADLRVEGGG